MKFLLGSAVAAFSLSLASLAAAQTPPATPPAAAPPAELLTSCVGLPAAPAAPDGATARRENVESALAAYNVWLPDFQAKAAACRTEIQTLTARVDASVAAFNAANRAAEAAGVTWTAEMAEFSARGNRRR
jgi:hypothetical protein